MPLTEKVTIKREVTYSKDRKHKFLLSMQRMLNLLIYLIKRSLWKKLLVEGFVLIDTIFIECFKYS